MKCTALPALAIFAVAVNHASAGPLREAKINQIVNDVKVIEPRQGARPAALQELIKDDLGVATGAQSRAELLFQDKTLTRLGAETFFSFQPGTRNLNLERGTMLLQVPKNLGGARIRAASVTASITGTTIMMENLPGKAVKLVVLEGSLNVAVAGRSSENVQLRAGKMMIVTPETKKLPAPVDADLRKLVRTSALIDPATFKGSSKAVIAALPSIGLIEKEIASQDLRLRSGGASAGILTPAGAGAGVPLTADLPLTASAPDLLPKLASVATTTMSQTDRETAVAVLKKDPELVREDSGATAKGGTKPSLDATASTSFQISSSSDAAIADNSTPSNDVLRSGTTNAGSGTSGSGTSGSGTPGSGTLGSGTSGSGTSGSGTSGSGTSGSGTSGSGTAIAPPAHVTTPNPYVLSDATTITTAGATISTGGVIDAGGIYQSAAINGPVSTYLFGTTSAFDAATGLDAKFGAMNGTSAPSAGVAVYRFGGLDVTGVPKFVTAGGPADLALVAQTGIASSASGGAWDVSALRSLFLGTENGPITLAKEIKKPSLLGPFQYLQIDARGSAGTATLDGKLTMPLANLYVDAEQGITVTSKAAITTLSTNLRSPGPIALNAAPLTATLQLTSGTGIDIAKPLIGAEIEMTAPVLRTAASISAATGFLNIGSGGVQAGASALSGFDRVDVAGDVVAGSVSVLNALNIGGTFKTGATNGAATLSAGSLAIGGGVDLTAANGTTGGMLTVNATDVNVAANGINGIKADGADGVLALVAGGDGGTVNIGTSTRPIANSIAVNKPISATTGANATGIATGGKGGAVNLVANGPVTVNSTVNVSDSGLIRASRTGGNIRIDSRKTSGTAIAVNSSGELLALLNAASTGAGGTITFTSAGGDIVVNGGKVQADKGTVDIRNNGAGNVALTNASIRGDVVKVGALGANGQLIIGGGTISADTSLKLYGGTTNGQVRFTDNVTLGGAGTKAIAGKTVTIDNGRTVTVGGALAAKVYTDSANYTGSGGNGSTTGQFGGAGATTQSYSKKPGF